MKNLLLMMLVAAFTVHTAGSQNLVGMSSGDIKSYLKDKKGVNPDSLYMNKNNDGTSYISFDSDGNKKVVYFMDSQDKCYTYRLIYPYNQLNAVLKKLDENFVPQGRFKWEVKGGRQNFVIILEPNDDFFVTDMSVE